MEAPPLPQRNEKKVKRPVPPLPTDDRNAAGNVPSIEETSSFRDIIVPELPLRNSQQSFNPPTTTPQRRRTEDVETLISRAPSVPTTMPEVFAEENDDGQPVEGRTFFNVSNVSDGQRSLDLRLSPSSDADLRVAGDNSGRHGKAAEAYACATEPTLADMEPPPPYNFECFQYSADNGQVNMKDQESAVLHAITVPGIKPPANVQEQEMIPDQQYDNFPSPAPHRRCYSDCTDVSSSHSNSIEDSDVRKGRRDMFPTSRDTASDVEYPGSSDENVNLHSIHTQKSHPAGSAVTNSFPNAPGPNGPGTPALPPPSGPPSHTPDSNPIAYPHPNEHPSARNPLHPSPTACEIREEWEPGMDPSFSSRSKLSNLLSSKAWKSNSVIPLAGASGETAWRRVWIELVPDDGWKVAVWEVWKCRGRNGEVVYQKKPSSSPISTHSLRHAVVTRPRTGYGTSRPDIVCIHLVNGKYLVLSMPDAQVQREWSKGVKAAAEMASRSPLKPDNMKAGSK
ncbi:uncharacterized protein SPPG_03598 [Spizellomyces punctatus DAOM BR117]|uniref:PH domain-containing protein n=1 Tax=Spizellomyces punctatus (strain DAOM BR117) TaxID=645134 RepID=A0A0L0HL05_SPIPD|nr:uncharacterized protein SPPG_03598 [Spizellomyces punctatus DAOM BR117]KND01807.1 hypothetical protein SPPG_03598 [Spizellomyces punctatus DAOM BR117]|eukprot:XP_016609846.1 hypothetical protein SPPG_03598 [Spizellomyces punctatus DAOM BR117]